MGYLQTKLVTGVAIDKECLKVQNKHHEAIHNLYVQHLEGTLRQEDRARLLGKLSSASQVSERYNSIFRHLLKTNERKRLITAEPKLLSMKKI